MKKLYGSLIFLALQNLAQAAPVLFDGTITLTQNDNAREMLFITDFFLADSANSGNNFSLPGAPFLVTSQLGGIALGTYNFQLTGDIPDPALGDPWRALVNGIASEGGSLGTFANGSVDFTPNAPGSLVQNRDFTFSFDASQFQGSGRITAFTLLPSGAPEIDSFGRTNALFLAVSALLLSAGRRRAASKLQRDFA